MVRDSTTIKVMILINNDCDGDDGDDDNIWNLNRTNLSLMKNTFQGDFVLCVKEGKKVSHYIINREDQGYRIGNSDFCSFSSRVR